MKKGSKEAVVGSIQNNLKAIGYDIGTAGPNGDGIDNNFGTKTDAAVRDVQKNGGVTVDGQVGKNTIAAPRRDVGGKERARGVYPNADTQFKADLSHDAWRRCAAGAGASGKAPCTAGQDRRRIREQYERSSHTVPAGEEKRGPGYWRSGRRDWAENVEDFVGIKEEMKQWIFKSISSRNFSY